MDDLPEFPYDVLKNWNMTFMQALISVGMVTLCVNWWNYFAITEMNKMLQYWD